MDSLTMTADNRATVKIPAAAIAARLIEQLATDDDNLLYVARSEGGAAEMAQAITGMAPAVAAVHLVPWDCLPFDRVGPSAESMGKRMQVLRAIQQAGEARLVIIASLEALLQRVPPADALAVGFLTLKAGDSLDLEQFRRHAAKTGYLPAEIVDQAGEIAFRDEMVDIFPPAGNEPLRIVIGDTGAITEIRTFDPVSQRTIAAVEELTVGPASELILPEAEEATPFRSGALMTAGLEHLYGRLDTVFDSLPRCAVCLAPGIAERLTLYLDIIDEARRAYHEADKDAARGGSLYLTRQDWDAVMIDRRIVELDLSGIDGLPRFLAAANPRQAFADHAEELIAEGYKLLVAGDSNRIGPLIRRLERRHGAAIDTADWQGALAAHGTVFNASFDIGEGFVDTISRVAIIAVADLLGTRTASSTDAAALLAEPELAIGDLVVHEAHGIGVFRALETIDIDGVSRDAMRLDYYGDDSILVPVEEFGHVWRYGSEEGAITLDRLHSDAWANRRAAIGKDIRTAAKHLIAMAAQRQDAAAEIIVPPQTSYRKFAARFPYAETPDQSQAIGAVLEDLSSGRPMNRLICGDVGFGKTEIALRATAAVALSGRQVVVLAPTTVLARQHFETFSQRFAGTGVKVAMLSRLVTASAALQVKADLAEGDVSVVIATQAILSKSVAYADLALVIVDEEHRFGARTKQQMGALAAGLHLLTMTATPIPRTLQSAMAGIQEVSILATPPVRRRPIRTFRRSFDLPLIKMALLREKRRAGQSFVVVPRIEAIDGLRQTLEKLVPELTVRIAHGKLRPAEMDEAMVAFGRGEGDILLSTNIIENGLDIPHANTMLIWHADRFGLAQLHQLRGRVGRGRAQGIVYLLTDDAAELAEQTTSRLETMVTHDRLGDGLAISAHDLDQRGAGDLVGDDQAGHLKLLGVSLYQHMLARAVAALRGDGGAQRRPPEINLGMTGAIPPDYVKDAAVRINLYARLLKLTAAADIDGFAEELIDRFGELPSETGLLLQLAELRIVAIGQDIAKLDVGPLGAAVAFGHAPTSRQWQRWTGAKGVTRRNDRLFAAIETEEGPERLRKIAAWLASLGQSR